jgi:hypothetical protein
MTEAKCEWAAQVDKLSKDHRYAGSDNEIDHNLALVPGYAWFVQNA